MQDQQEKSPISALGLLIWGLAAFFFLYEFFLRTFIGSVAHQVIHDLRLNAETFAILGSAYYIAYGVMQVPVGILVDKFGVKLIMTFAILVCAAATLLFAHSAGFSAALISRMLMGFGSSFAFVCLLVIAVTWFPKRYFAFFAGTSQFIGTLGPLLAGGPLIAVMSKYHQDWRTTLSEIALFGFLLAAAVFLVVRNKPRGGEQALVYLQTEIPLSTRLWRLAKNRQAWFVALYSATSYVSISLLGAIWGTEYLQAVGLSQPVAASIISLTWFAYGISCPLLGALSDIAKRRKPVLLLCATIGLIATSVITFLPLHHTWAYAIAFFGLGIAASGQNVGFAAIAEHVDIATRASALGLNNGAMTLFASFIPPLASFFISHSAGTNPLLVRDNFTLGFSIMPLLYCTAIVIAWLFIKETYCKPQQEAIVLNPTLNE